VLIFDEVMTGFRVGPGGVQEREGVLPDLTTLGKIIGGGLPVGAFGGRAEIMDCLSPLGASTRPARSRATRWRWRPASRPCAPCANRASTSGSTPPAPIHRRPGRAFRRHGIAAPGRARGSMVGFFFTDTPVVDLPTAKTADTAFYGRFFHEMLDSRRLSGAVPVRGRLPEPGPR
jgi:glutamate-1-semialdehyde 2,1-aminomutase